MSAKPPIPLSFPSHTPHSLFPIHPLPLNSDAPFTDNPAPVHHQMDPNAIPQPRYPSTCIPSLMPPGVDPTSVDFRTFFPYIPNEVKHRKRTSRHQLKVLEDVFRKDTKPNAVLRKKLAAELDMSPRAVQVWFQNRRAKEKALRKRVATGADQEKPASPSMKKSPPPRDTSPNNSSNSSTATEKPARHTEDDIPSGPPHVEPNASPVLKISCSPPPLPGSPSAAWAGFSGTPVDIPPHVRLLDPSGQDPDLYSTRRGSLPTVMPSQPLAGPNLTQLPIHYPDRRNSMDVNFFRLVHHPFARIAKEKNEALYLPKSPLSSAGAIPPHLARPPGIGAIRPNGHGYPHPRPNLSHRASEPQVFAPVRTPFPPVPEGGLLQSLAVPSRRYSDNRLYAISSRTISSPIPGPLPTPDFQFGDPSSVSPPNASPTPGEVESSPSVPLQSPEIAQMQQWSFPRSREPDQDTEDSGSCSGFSRFGSVASVSGSESSAMYSDVSSCVAVDHIGYDPSTRRGSCAPGNYLEMQLSTLNMTGRSSQGSLNEAQLSTAAALAYRDKLARQEDTIGGYVSPASTASPGTSPLIRQVKESAPSALRNESIYDYGPLSQVPENAEIATTRRGSMQSQEHLNIYVQNPLETQGPYPTPPSEPRESSVRPAISQQHYPHGSGFTPQSGFANSGEPSFVPGSGSAQPDGAYQQRQSTHLQYSPEGTMQGTPNTMGVRHANVSRYALPAGEYTYTASHGQEPFASFT
ncbi:hypothetical protein L210DRAFT_2083431 [Boletus edulis BED1]|uniref:Homeobox domain-containing protein n=1 Tax=Boletus edulis BED1 TaxID=1328754 RepID=A0AAD4BW14_BOLED|nr:hypothetical protein L210DRAFT_2083431 [Boletus edulis BED1]